MLNTSHQQIIESSWTFETAWLLLKHTKKLLTEHVNNSWKQFTIANNGNGMHDARASLSFRKKCKFCQGLSFTHRLAIGLRYSQLHLLAGSVTVRPVFYLPACLGGFCHFLLNIPPPLIYQQLLLDILWIYLFNQAQLNNVSNESALCPCPWYVIL